MSKNNSYLPNLEPYLAAGFNPKTGLPMRMDSVPFPFKDGIKKALRILDEQNAVTRYQWYNIPCDLTSEELERLIYYKGQLCMFYCEPLDSFYITPYALDGTIDFYGRFNTVHPVPMANGTDKDSKYDSQLEYLSRLKLRVLYDVPYPDDDIDPLQCCVLIHDYTKQLSQTIIPRQQLQEPVLDAMSDCFPFMRTALYNSTGVEGIRVNSQDEQSNVIAANASIDRAAFNGQKFVPLQGSLDFQMLTGGATGKAEEFLLAMQALDNFRLSLYGLDNGGLFQKKSHMLESEQQMNAGHARGPLNNGLSIRQHSCDIANSIWGIGMTCEISESSMGADFNGDGLAYDTEEQSGTAPGQQPEVYGGNDVD